MINKETAVFAGGCFWCLEAVYKRLNGVLEVKSGYTGGQIKNPTYREVCSGLTGHAEAVRVIFDPEKISFKVLLDVFFSMHNPTTLNRQGADIGTQYRSAIFYIGETQKKLAGEYISGLSAEKIFEEEIVTQLEPLTEFYNAEDYHDDYYDQNREKNSYCTAVIDPKVNKLRKSFSSLLKTGA